MARSAIVCILVLALACVSVQGAALRTLKQANPTTSTAGATITVTTDKPNVDAIAITPVLPYPQTAYYCNVSGDSRLSVGAFFPLTVRVPVGVSSKVIFANITGTIPGTNGSGSQPGCSSVVQQPGTSVVQQPGTSVVQQPGSSVVQQPGSSVVQQPGSSVVQQPGTAAANCTTSVVQQPGTSVVQQPGTSVVQQPGTSVVQQPGTSVVQQPGTSVVQQPGTSVVQQPGSTVVQQPSTPGVTTSIVQQQQGRRLLQTPAPVEYISNNGSVGQPLLSVLDTVEGVPNIVFTPTAAGQTASFSGALQVAVTTTNDGFGTPYIPYQVDARLSPNCGLKVNFVSF